MEQRKGEWVPTFSGLRFWPLDPRPEEVRGVDLAHHLAKADRFGKALPIFYGVGQHSIYVAMRVLQLTGCKRKALYGLTHDGSEAYFSDVPRPVKHLPEMMAYRTAEARCQRVVYAAFGLDPDMVPPEVGQADEELLATEVAQLCPWGVNEWWRELRPAWVVPSTPLPDLHIRPWGWERTRAVWLKTYCHLTGERVDLLRELPVPEPMNVLTRVMQRVGADIGPMRKE